MQAHSFTAVGFFFTVLQVAQVTERIHANRITKPFPSVSTAEAIDTDGKPLPEPVQAMGAEFMVGGVHIPIAM